MKDTTKLSKTLSYILRHTDIPDKNGWIHLDKLILLPELKGNTIEDVLKVVKNCPKQRFKIQDNKIRANQGHSVEKDITMEEITDASLYPIVIHGTFKKFLEKINEEGLCRMKRNHIHMATSLDAKSGCRKDCQVFIYIDIKKCMQDGMKFYKSDNGVILSSGIDGYIMPEYFSQVVMLNT